jgi:flagellum-specific peptidoglycan hydrolase FlgJ
MAASTLINSLLFPGEEQKLNSQIKANAYLLNPFLKKDGSLTNKYINYQAVIDNPNTNDKVRRYITEATGLAQTVSPVVPSVSGNSNSTVGQVEMAPLENSPAASINETTIPANTTSASPQTTTFSGSADFVNKMLPYAQKVIDINGLKVDPETIVAQWALESAWGKSNFAKNRNNFAGINAVDSNPNKATSYNTIDDFAVNYAKFIKGKTYVNNGVLNAASANDYYTALKKGGYATDPNYISSLNSVYRTIKSLK